MRGQPSVQLLFVLLAFAALGVPVWRLTRSAEAGAAVPGRVSAGSSDVTARPGMTAEETLAVSVVFAPAPEEFHLQSLGRDVLAGRGPLGEFSGSWKTALPPDGLDLALQARWAGTADDAPGAVRVTVRFPDDRAPAVEKTFWAPRGGTLVELVTVPGSAAAKPE